MKELIPAEKMENSILAIRGEKVMLDAALKILYGVSTKRLDEQVKRNRDRFPADFTVQLTENKKGEVVANCDHQVLVSAGIAERQTAAGYLKELEKIGILKVHKMGRENLYPNVQLYKLLLK
ncbi:MAG: ORF6N domain-containing protein [Nitrospirota bacterium]